MENEPVSQPTVHIPEYVMLPADDFRQMRAEAVPYTPPTTGDRVNQAAQTSLLFVGFGALAVGGAWTYAKVTDYIEQRRHNRLMDEKELTWEAKLRKEARTPEK